jgi:hypothetical protein
MKHPGSTATIVLICLFAALSVHAQQTYVNKGYEKGMMNGIYKTGNWQYFDSAGTLDMEIDYDKGVLTYLRRDTSEYVIFENGRWVTSRLEIPPRYIGSWVEYYDILNESLDYPAQARYRDVVGKVYIIFEVDTSGKAVNFEPVNDIGCECAYECMRVLQLVPNYWLVAAKNGVKYRSRFLFSCEFGIIMDGKRITEKSRRSRKRKQDILALPPARQLNGISYIIRKGYNPE